MSALRIHLLGDFSLCYGDVLLAGVDTPRLQSLLARLVLLHQETPIARQRLAFLLWPDTHEAQARTNLRNLLHQLRKRLPEGVREFLVYEDRKTVQWRPDAHFSLDVTEFEKLITAAVLQMDRNDKDAARHSLEAALSLYRSDLWPSCYEDWIAPVREHLRNRYAEAAEQLIHLLREQRDYPAAIRCAQKLRHSDLLREASSLHLMRLFALSNDEAGAVRIYREYAQTLKRELDMEPGQEMQHLYQSLLAGSASNAPLRMTPAALTGHWPLVNRQTEWKQLTAAWECAMRGHAHLVLLTGEAGIGKTRLAEELLVWASRTGAASARAQAYALGQVAYNSVSDWLRSPAFQSALARLDALWLAEVARILPELLVARPELQPPAPLTDSWQQNRFFDALVRVAVAGNRPLLLLLDDLQWCDQETLGWLFYLLQAAATAPLLLVGTLRSDFNAEQAVLPFLQNLRRNRMVTEIELPALSEAETIELAAYVTGKAVDAHLARHLYYESEGNPLFVVEMARAALLSEGEAAGSISPGGALPMPPLIRTVIEARLSQLSPPARALANIAATIGREFTLDVLIRAGHDELAMVAEQLDELRQRQIIREQGQGYYFTHDKLREVVYAGMNAVRRLLLHQRVGDALALSHAANLDAASGQIAVHYERAAMPDKAIAFYQRAAEAAQRVIA